MKHALVTGASGSIGEAICYQLAKHFHIIAHANKNISRAEKIVAHIQQQGGSAQAISFDISNPQATETQIKSLLESHPIQVFVHNAGTHDDAPLAGMDYEQWRSVLSVNLDGFYHALRPLIMPMIRTRWGRIITISSIAARGNRGQVNYAAAKAGTEGAVKSLALEVASRGITVNAIAPGIIDTPMSHKIFDAEKIASLVPMKRAGTCEEVAALVGFLASEPAAYLSGQVIAMNGAML